MTQENEKWSLQQIIDSDDVEKSYTVKHELMRNTLNVVIK